MTGISEGAIIPYVGDKNLNEIVGEFRINTVLANKELSFEYTCYCSATRCDHCMQRIIYQMRKEKTMKLFSNELVDKLQDNQTSVGEKVREIKKYVDTTKIQNGIGEFFLNYFVRLCTIFGKHSDFLDFLLKLGPNLNIISDSFRPTILFEACNPDFGPIDETTVIKLINAGADGRIKNPDGQTCFEKRRSQLQEDYGMQMRVSCGLCLVDPSFPSNIEARYFKNIDSINSLEKYAKESFIKLQLEKKPIPTRLFTVRRQVLSGEEIDLAYGKS